MDLAISCSLKQQTVNNCVDVLLTRVGWVRAPGVSSMWQQTRSVHRLHSSATGSESKWLLAAVFLSCASVFAAAAL
jgi:hypothetical protein